MILIKVKLDGDLISGNPERNTNNTFGIANRKQELNSMNIHEFSSEMPIFFNKQWLSLHIKFCVHYSSLLFFYSFRHTFALTFHLPFEMNHLKPFSFKYKLN